MITQSIRSRRVASLAVLFAGSLFLTILPLAHAANGNGNGNGNSGSGGAGNQLTITGASPNYVTNTLVIDGANVGTSFTGTATLEGPGGTIALSVVAFDAAQQKLTVGFPATLPSTPGTYLLTYTNYYTADRLNDRNGDSNAFHNVLPRFYCR